MKTAELYGDLWRRYSNELFEESVQLFYRRFEANGFDLKWFEGKRCLDVGCGGGRYSIAMARLGAEVAGIDISGEGLEDARKRVRSEKVTFQEADACHLSFPDASFDFVCCSGVLHHIPSSWMVWNEIARVLKPGGLLYLMVYGAGGLRWPLVGQMRRIARDIGYRIVNEVSLRILPINKQRTFLDDLFVPYIQFAPLVITLSQLKASGWDNIELWEKGKLDHEASRGALRQDLEYWGLLFRNLPGEDAKRMVGKISWVWYQTWFRSNKAVFGEGNIRLLARRK